MRRLCKAASFGTILSFALASTTAVAGEAVAGFGDTRAQAAAAATQNVRQASYERFRRSDCYTPVRPQDCRLDGGSWICIAYVANHRGSCGN